MSTPLTKAQIKTRLGIKTGVDLALWFEVTPAAISQWHDDQPIPEARWLYAQLKRPDLFDAAAKSEAA